MKTEMTRVIPKKNIATSPRQPMIIFVYYFSFFFYIHFDTIVICWERLFTNNTLTNTKPKRWWSISFDIILYDNRKKFHMAIVGRISSSDAPVRWKDSDTISQWAICRVWYFLKQMTFRIANSVQTNGNAQTRTQFTKRNERKKNRQNSRQNRMINNSRRRIYS